MEKAAVINEYTAYGQADAGSSGAAFSCCLLDPGAKSFPKQ